MNLPKQQTGHAQAASGPRLSAWVLCVSAAALLCAVDAAIVRRDTPQSAGIGYLLYSIAVFCCALPFFLRSHAASGALRARWMLMAAATAVSATGFTLAFIDCFYPGHSATRIAQISCFTSGEAMYLLSAVLFFSNVGRAVVLVDTLQVFVFVLLRFHLTFSAVTWDHFYVGHLLVGQLVAFFLFVIAAIACAGASSRNELHFLRTLTWYFGLRFITFFLSDQISYVWLGHTQSSIWDTAGTAAFAGLALYLNFDRRVENSASGGALTRLPSIAVRNLMPSFLALVNLTLGLVVLRGWPTTAHIALALTLLFYVLRSTLFQSQAAKERAQLQRRNEHLEGLATKDPLTGCGNRRSLADTFKRLQGVTISGEVALLLMDIDHFKQANDRFGHIHGDGILIVLAQKLEEFAARVPNAHCARFGGDEFALMLPGISLVQASVLAEQLRTAFASHRFRDADSEATLSVGVAVRAHDVDASLEDLLAAADDALYRAKLAGRNRVAAA